MDIREPTHKERRGVCRIWKCRLDKKNKIAGETLQRQVQLFLIDEVHILNETRGSTLEVVVSRMKARGSSVRFLAVSATVPNVNDVAAWVGAKAGDGPAEVYEVCISSLSLHSSVLIFS